MSIPYNNTRAWLDIVSNLFGAGASLFWSFQLVPQAVKNYQTKSTEGLSPAMLITWSIGSIFFFTYGTVQNLPTSLTLEPAFFIVFATICWAQCVQYNRGRWQERMQKLGLTNPVWVWFIAFITMTLIMGISLYLILIGMQAAANQQVDWIINAAGIIPVILYTIGFVPQYIDIYRSRAVRGISRIFILMDMTGSILSIVSLHAPPFDVLASFSYISVFVLDGGILLLSFILPSSLDSDSTDLESSDDSVDDSVDMVEVFVMEHYSEKDAVAIVPPAYYPWQL
ncbi:PQ loop repeat-domain-containing protein [Endogone sp. FLAS-F59071]|nr:PQ loop repeat-domain-containing protein [Endogone sp. FLAS-F59071]|eukprot:RUS13310.1 PQ loop repeat-domain-containing protein [Endogone sp. FLAS-F59071]